MAAKKINLKNIAEEANNICNATKLDEICFDYEKTNSSARVDNMTQIILEYFLPVILLEIFYFYKLKKLNSELDNEIKKFLNVIYSERIKSFKDELGPEEIIKYLEPIEKLLSKLWVVKKLHTKKSFQKLDFITFNDTSNDAAHIKAFNQTHSSNRQKNNFILKIDSTGPESTPIRFGVYINGNHITLLDLVTK